MIFRGHCLRSAQLIVIGSLLFDALDALAQGPTANGDQSRPTEIVMPRRVSDVPIDYPKGAHGDAEVILELVIDAAGTVREARVVTGEEPFAAQALSAAKDWRFAPARRADTAVAARIHFRVSFREPVAPESSAAPEADPVPAVEPKEPAARSRSANPAPSLQVNVQGERREPAAKSLSEADVRQMPGAFGDPFRAIESLPGVTPIGSGAPFFFVRGAPPGNTGYFLDGIRVPYLYHLGLGPSVVNPRLVERVDFYPGGYPARFGRFTGGIVAGESAPAEYAWHADASLRLVDAGGLLEIPFADQRGSVLVSGRYGYPGLLLPLFAPKVVLDYWDYQARASYALTSTDEISIFAFGAHDLLGERQSDGRIETKFDTEFHRVDLRYDRRMAGGSRLRVALLAGLDRSPSTNDLFVRDRMIGVRSEVSHRIDAKALVRFGTDTELDVYDQRPTHADGAPSTLDLGPSFYRIEDLFKSRTDVTAGAWADVVLDPEPGITVTPGIRADYYVSEGHDAIGVDPRLAARLAVSRRVHLVHTLALAHQPPSFVGPLPGLALSGLPGGLQRSIQASSGVELDLAGELSASATVFDHVFLDMTDLLGASRWRRSDDVAALGLTRHYGEYDERSLGSTLGLELSVRRPVTKRLSGFASYTLSRSLRSAEREHFPARFDRTHVLNVAGAYDLGRHWRAGCRFVFYTGNPAEVESPLHVRTLHPERLPPFYRLDVRAEKRWPLGRRGYWALVLEILNATLNQEVIDTNCEHEPCTRRTIGPVTIPSIGLEASL